MARGPAEPTRQLSGLAAIGCGALVVVALCHLPTLGYGFLDWDDGLHVTRNPSVLTPGSVSLREHLTTPVLGYPIPVTIASYAIEAAVLDRAPWHFHLINVLLHVANTALVFALACRLGLRGLGAACAALLFGLHPVVAEPVSWVTGRKDLLAACLGLSALRLAWPPSSLRRRAIALVCFALGLLAKPAIAPICLLVAAAGRAKPRDALKTVLPYLVVLAPIAVLGLMGQSAVGAVVESDRAGAGFVRSAWYALGFHLRLLFGLEEPTAKYVPLPWPPSFTPGVDAMPLIAAAWIALCFMLPEPQRRAARFGGLCAGLMYLPSSNLIPLSRYLADSYLYLPLIGLAWCSGAAVEALAARASRMLPIVRWGVPALLLAVCVPALLRSQARFANDRALWAHALQRYPHNPRVCRQWANGVAKVDGPERGLLATDACLQRFGDELFAKNKGVLLARLGRFAEAREWLERARERHPEDVTLQRALDDLAMLQRTAAP